MSIDKKEIDYFLVYLVIFGGTVGFSYTGGWSLAC